MSSFEAAEEYHDRFAWRRRGQIARLSELCATADPGGPYTLDKLPGLFPINLASEDPRDALRWSILMLWQEAAECYILGEFQSCILTCGAIVERCLKLAYITSTETLRPFEGRWGLGKCIENCEGIVSSEVIRLAKGIVDPRNSLAHALLEHSDPRVALLGGPDPGREWVSDRHYGYVRLEYQGDARKVTETTWGILTKLYAHEGKA